jgi:hypothetical protein
LAGVSLVKEIDGGRWWLPWWGEREEELEALLMCGEKGRARLLFIGSERLVRKGGGEGRHGDGGVEKRSTAAALSPIGRWSRFG